MLEAWDVYSAYAGGLGRLFSSRHVVRPEAILPLNEIHDNREQFISFPGIAFHSLWSTLPMYEPLLLIQVLEQS